MLRYKKIYKYVLLMMLPNNKHIHGMYNNFVLIRIFVYICKCV